MKLLLAFRPEIGATYPGQMSPMIQGKMGTVIAGAPGLVFYVIEAEVAFEIAEGGAAPGAAASAAGGVEPRSGST